MCDISISVAKKYAKPNPPFKKKNNVAMTDTGCTTWVRENEECKSRLLYKCKYKLGISTAILSGQPNIYRLEESESIRNG